MKKVVMNLDDYKGRYVMHCPTEESAKLFCEFLYENRVWKDGSPYLLNSNWENYTEDTIYYFNEGMYGSIEIAEEEGYKILKIEDFIQEV